MLPDTSTAMGARTVVTPVAFIQAAMLSRASASGSEGWKTRLGKFFAKWTICSPEPLAISRMTPVIGRTSRRTSRMKSRLRRVAGAYWRSSLIFLMDFGELMPSPIAPNSGDGRSASSPRALGHDKAAALWRSAGHETCRRHSKTATAAWSPVSIYNGTITFCTVPLISMHRHDDGRRGMSQVR